MSQFNNYFENKCYVDPDDYKDIYNLSNIWPSNHIEQPKKIVICKAYGLLTDVDDILTERKYVTEGEMRDILDLKSEVSNPFRFYDGDKDACRRDLQEKLEERKQQLKSYRREVRLIEEALKEIEI